MGDVSDLRKISHLQACVRQLVDSGEVKEESKKNLVKYLGIEEDRFENGLEIGNDNVFRTIILQYNQGNIEDIEDVLEFCCEQLGSYDLDEVIDNG